MTSINNIQDAKQALLERTAFNPCGFAATDGTKKKIAKVAGFVFATLLTLGIFPAVRYWQHLNPGKGANFHGTLNHTVDKIAKSVIDPTVRTSGGVSGVLTDSPSRLASNIHELKNGKFSAKREIQNLANALVATSIRKGSAEQFGSFYAATQEMLQVTMKQKGIEGSVEDAKLMLQEATRNSIINTLLAQGLKGVTADSYKNALTRLQAIYKTLDAPGHELMFVEAIKERFGANAITTEIATVSSEKYRTEAAAAKRKTLEGILAQMQGELKGLRGVEARALGEFNPLNGFTGSIDKVFKDKLQPANKALEDVVKDVLTVLSMKDIPTTPQGLAQLLGRLATVSPDLKAKLEEAMNAQAAAQAEYDALKKRYNELVGEDYSASSTVVAGSIGKVMEQIGQVQEIANTESAELAIFLQSVNDAKFVRPVVHHVQIVK